VLLRRVAAGLRALLHRREDEQDLHEELREYLEAAVEQNLAAGMSLEEARRAAQIAMGSLEATKDAVRDVGWESRLESLWLDLRHALRGLRRSPGFAAVAVLTLALGIGINTAIFSVVNGLLLRTLPVTEPERLALVSSRNAIDQGFPAGWNYAIWDQIRERQHDFDGALAWSVFPQRLDLSRSGERQPAEGLFVSAAFFQELGMPMLAGRPFTPAEDVLGASETRVAVISYGFWQRRFGGAADTIGQTISVNRVPVTVIGITPPAFLGPEVGRAFEVALPIGGAPDILSEPEWSGPAGRSYLAIMMRLRPDQSIDSGSAMLQAKQRQIIQAAMPAKGIWGAVQDDLMKDPFSLIPASSGTSELRRQYSQSLVTVLAIAMLVLLIACANIANLLLARSTAARREWSVRLALGAPRRRLIQQLLVESLVLSGLGAVAGLLLAVWGSRLLVAQLSTWFERVVLDVSIDVRVLAFTATVSIVTALLFGTMPAVRASRLAPGAALKDAPVDRGGGRLIRLRGGLVAAQVGLSLVLLIAAGLFIRSFERIVDLPLGFESERVLVVDVNTSRTSVDASNRGVFFQRLADAVRTTPGVTHAGVSLNTPVNRGPTALGGFKVVGGPELPQAERRTIVNLVTPGWFETYGMTPLAGRVIDSRDTDTGAPVAVVNEAFVRKFFPNREALWQSIVSDQPDPDKGPVPITIVGIVRNAVDQSLRSDPFPTLYQPLDQFTVLLPLFDFSLSVRAESGSPALLARGVSTALTSFDRNLAFGFNPLTDQLADARQQERLVAWLAGSFGGLALLLAAIGLHGVTSYTVERRRTEIGIRMALGAQRRDVVRLAVRHTLLMTVGGVIVGIAVSAAVTRYLQGLLFGVTPLDPMSFGAAAALLVAVALIACYLPARRVATIAPMNALRCE
jgi:putative ABC transport system permease protein